MKRTTWHEYELSYRIDGEDYWTYYWAADGCPYQHADALRAMYAIDNVQQAHVARAA